ncbi:cell division protease FtsH [Verrucomicrobium sp. GAS474]|uniref:ATP-dependent zinc metalloprotease FtsH n=1 Tax=Verrucomicrobium sp. GAS474 TaxID=1882831 RepID=UPI00087A0EB0|nr:ATP-dependent zinc metalloprotease FtsH [Verrucomicrobium sp. GAS474]SDU28633.1 cell division protease FtsH [Verrucomicrobium sp. GAS474]
MANSPIQYPKPRRKRSSTRNKNASSGKTPTPNTDPSQNDPSWRGGLILVASVFFIVAAYYFMMGAGSHVAPTLDLSRAELRKALEEKRVEPNSIVFVRESGSEVTFLKGKVTHPKSATDATPVTTPFRTPVDLGFTPDLSKTLAENGFPDVETETTTNGWSQLLSFLPIILFILFIYFIFRQQLKMAGKNAFSFGKSRARMLNQDKNKITFKDVAGVEEAKEEVSEIVEFLRDPRKFQKLGGRIPKGVLMVGPPGTGKTLIAKAIAGEADVPFFSISGSDFVEMFVGVGASRVRDMFEQAKKTAPCIIFIDEIDAVGRSRGTGMGGGHDEREQTLNALLVEMDGIESQEGVIIVAATNRKDVLDPALLRPGRFDREVRVSLPDIKGREQIIAVHVKKVKIDPKADLNALARGTPGFSGAELANLINEAALIAAKANKEQITQPDLEEARDKVRWGRERRSLAMTEKEKKNTAYHEAGHAVLNVLLENTDPLHKVTIIPRGPSLGSTMYLPETDKYNSRKKELLDFLCVAAGGRVAEEIFFGELTSGASGDIQQLTWYARKMVCEWGMSEKLGMIRYGDDSNMLFLGRDLGGSRGYSEKTAEEIDHEVLDLVNGAHAKATALITEYRSQTEAIALALIEYETLDGQQVTDIVKTGKMTNPPPKNIEPPVLPTPSEPLPANPEPEKKPKDDDGLLPGLQGAPAGA